MADTTKEIKLGGAKHREKADKLSIDDLKELKKRLFKGDVNTDDRRK